MFGLVGNINKPEVIKTNEKIIDFLIGKNIDFYIESELSKKINNIRKIKKNRILSIEKLISKVKIIIASGGDGTILATAGFIGNKNVAILGVNLGKLGFLAEASSQSILDFVDDILKHNYKIESRTLLEVTFNNKKFFGLNDVVIDKGSSSRIVEIKSLINKFSLIDFIGDGIIIATPTGSTGYSLATGGPIVAPTSEVFVISPICAHTLTARSMVIPDDCTIEIIATANNQKVRLTIDGQQKVFADKKMKIKIKKASHSIKLIKAIDSNYYDVLRKKLIWNFDTRTKGVL